MQKIKNSFLIVLFFVCGMVSGQEKPKYGFVYKKYLVRELFKCRGYEEYLKEEKEQFEKEYVRMVREVGWSIDRANAKLSEEDSVCRELR